MRFDSTTKQVSLPKPELVPLRSLRPFPNNARTHSKRQIAQIARSIERFGFTNPVLIDEQKQILAGHGRVAAALQLGLKLVPTLRFDHLTADEKRAYVLNDNKLAEKAGWDREILAIELHALIDIDFDMELTGFDTAEIDSIIDDASEETNGAVEDLTEPYDAENVVCQPGDVWVLGRHRLICADARNPNTYQQLLGKERAEFIFTDPPFNLPIDGHVCGLGRIRHREFAMGCGEMTSAQFTEFLQHSFACMASFSVPGSIHQICIDWRHLSEMLAAGNAVYSELKNLCVWNKTNAGMGSFYRSKHELVFVWKYGTSQHINNFELGQHGRHRTNVWDYAGVNTFGGMGREDLSLHPTVKPVALIADAIKDCSKRSGIVLDAFCGSGSVALA